MEGLSAFTFIERYCCDNTIYRLSLHKMNTKEEVGFVLVDLHGDLNRYREYCNGDNLAHIVRLETEYSYTKRGIAHALLNKLFETFKDWNFSLLVYPTYRGEKDYYRKDLQKWYEQFGFVRTKEFTTTMVKKNTLCAVEQNS